MNKLSSRPDPRAQVLLEQIKEAETAQAIDRRRLVLKPKRTRSTRVFILSNIPVDIEVDQLFRWEQYQFIQRLVNESDGYIPLIRRISCPMKNLPEQQVWLPAESKRLKITGIGIGQLDC